MTEPNTPQQVPPKAVEAARLARLSTLHLFFGFLLSFLPLPAAGLAIIPLAASLIYGVRHVRTLKRLKAPTGVVRMGWISIVMTTFLVAMVAAPLAQYQRSFDYQRCMWGANTQLAKSACADEYKQHPGPVQQFFTS